MIVVVGGVEWIGVVGGVDWGLPNFGGDFGIKKCLISGEKVQSCSFFHEYFQTLSPYCKITYFRWDFISRFCHIVSLHQSKICVFGRVVIENPLDIFIVLFSRSYHPRKNK
jgi:hypothetical protein